MHNHILPFDLNVPIRTWTFQAYPYGILWQHHEFRAWLYNFNINICVPNDIFRYLSWGFVHLEPIISFEQLTAAGFLVEEEGPQGYCGVQVVDEVQRRLRKRMYSRLLVDDYYIRGPQFGHSAHDTLVIGYDAESGTFIVPAYNSDARYVCQGVAVQNLTMAVDAARTGGYLQQNGYACAAVTPDAKFQPGLVMLQLSEYLQSARATQRYPWFDNSIHSQIRADACSFGHNGCLRILDYLDACLQAHVQPDPRITRQLLELKRMMLGRVDYIKSFSGPAALSLRTEPLHDAMVAALQLHLAVVSRAAGGHTQSIVDAISAARRTFPRELEGLRRLFKSLEELPGSSTGQLQ